MTMLKTQRPQNGEKKRTISSHRDPIMIKNNINYSMRLIKLTYNSFLLSHSISVLIMFRAKLTVCLHFFVD